MPSCFSRICEQNLTPSAYITQRYATSYVAKTPPGKKKEIIVKILDANQQWVPVRAIFDTGNDLTILTAATAKQLGLYNPNIGQPLDISGIAGGGQNFRMFPNYIQIGDLQPIKISMGFALNNESLPVNLIGNKDILDSGKYTVIMDEDTIELHEKMPMANID